MAEACVPRSRVTEKHVTPKNAFAIVIEVYGLLTAEITLNKY